MVIFHSYVKLPEGIMAKSAFQFFPLTISYDDEVETFRAPFRYCGKLSGWWYTYPSEKYKSSSMGRMTSHI